MVGGIASLNLTFCQLNVVKLLRFRKRCSLKFYSEYRGAFDVSVLLPRRRDIDTWENNNNTNNKNNNQSHPPVRRVLKWKILESALGSAPEGAPGHWGGPGSAPRVLREIGGAPGSASRECSFC